MSFSLGRRPLACQRFWRRHASGLSAEAFCVIDHKSYHSSGSFYDRSHKKFLELISGYVRTPYKLNQILTNAGDCLPTNFQKEVDRRNLLQSWWLAGFTDADGFLYIQVLKNRKPSDTVRIQLKFSLKERLVLDQLSAAFGSTVGIRKHQNNAITYYWSSSTNNKALDVYVYFHQYSLQSKKWLEFMYWRKALRLVYECKPLTSSTLTKIKTYKVATEKLRV